MEPQQVNQINLKWEPLVLTREKVDYLWEQIRQYPQVFDDFSKGDKDSFVHKFFVPNNIFIDIGPGVGLAAGFAVRPGLDTVLHLVMFDRRIRGREHTFLEIMQYFFKGLKLRRMTAMVSSDNPMLKKLVERLGFKLEGNMRSSVMRDGKICDTFIYGILREELDDTMSSAQSTGSITDNPSKKGENGLLLGVGSEKPQDV